MPRALWLPDILTDAGLGVVTVPGWETRGSGLYDPWGVLEHHTGSGRGRVSPSLGVVTNGRTGLPGPLCQVLIDRAAICHVITSGRANHAGIGGPLAGIGPKFGNYRLLGIETENDGIDEPYAGRVLEAKERATAAILTYLGRSADWCWGHKEWAPTRKIDPRFDMHQFRARVRARMTLSSQPPTTQEITMAVPQPTLTEVAAFVAEEFYAVGNTDEKGSRYWVWQIATAEDWKVPAAEMRRQLGLG